MPSIRSDLRRPHAGRSAREDDRFGIVSTAIAGCNVSEQVEGRERYPINVRYIQNFRQDLDALRHVLVATPQGAQVPVSQLAALEFVMGLR